MAEERDMSSSLLAKLAVTESSEIPSGITSGMETTSELRISKSEGEGQKEGEIAEGTQMQTVNDDILDNISEDEDDEDDTNLVVLDPNHVRTRCRAS